MDLKQNTDAQKPKFQPIKRVLDLRGVLEYKYSTLNPHHNFEIFV